MIPEWMLLMDMTPAEREAYEENKALAQRIEKREARLLGRLQDYSAAGGRRRRALRR